EQLIARYRSDFDPKVDAIEERPGNARPVARDLGRRAAALARGIAEVSARAGIHGRGELEARRVLDLQRGARDRDHAALERLAQRLQHRAVELRQLVEEQHAEMRQADLAGPRARSTSDDGAGRRAVVRRAERPATVVAWVESAVTDRGDGRHVERLVRREWRQK